MLDLTVFRAVRSFGGLVTGTTAADQMAPSSGASRPAKLQVHGISSGYGPPAFLRDLNYGPLF